MKRPERQVVDDLKAWKRVGSRTLYRSAHVLIREDALELPSGQARTYPVLHLGASAGVLPSFSDDRISCGLSKLAILWSAVARNSGKGI